MECQTLGGRWDLAILNNNEEFDFIAGVIESECWSEQAFWIGFNEYDTIDNGDGTYSPGDIKTIFGRVPDWKIEWSTEFGGEPNDSTGDEQCLRLKDNTVNDAMCDRTWTGAKNDNIGMGVVCEQHNFYEGCEKKMVDHDPNYSISFGGGKGWEDAQNECIAKGTGWDLAVPNTEDEMDYFVDLANCDDGGIWLGMKWIPHLNTTSYNSAGTIAAVDNSVSPIVRWDKHTNWDSPNPNTNSAVTECIRMRGDLVVDASCDRTHGPSRRPYPQPYGWICEYTAPECTVDPAAEPLVDGEYVIRFDEKVNWNGARQQCKGIGKHWDLAIFNHIREYERITSIINSHCIDEFAYWVGYRENNGVGVTIFDQELFLKEDGFTTSIPLPWDLTSNTVSPEPNNWLGSEECVRMRGGEMNDALCSRTWTGAKKQGTV